MNTEIPVACSLTDTELQHRRKNYLDRAAESLIDSAELSDGFVFRFPLRDSILLDLAEIVELERKCCPFLNFRLAIEAGSEVISLELTGARGAKEIVGSLFNGS